MAASYVKGITSLKGFQAYCRDPKAHYDAERELGERLLYCFGNTAAHPRDVEASGAEIRSMGGNGKYQALTLRVSLPPDERLTEREAKRYTAIIAKNYFGDRVWCAYWHGDSHCLHVHIIASVRDLSNRMISFKGKQALIHGAHRMDVIDRASRAMHLSTIARPPGRCKRTGDRLTDSKTILAMRRERLNDPDKYKDKPVWLDAAGLAVGEAIKEAKTIEDFFKQLEARGWVKVRETEKSLTISDGTHKVRLARLNPSLGCRAKIALHLHRRQKTPTTAPTRTLPRSQIVDCGQSCGVAAATSTGGGGISTDSNDPEEQSMIAAINKSLNEVQQAINRDNMMLAQEEQKRATKQRRTL